MTIRVYSPFQVTEELQTQIDERVGKLQRFFDRIRSTEVYLKELEAEQSKSDSKVVELKVYMMRRVLHASVRAKNLEEALSNAVETMRKQLKDYEKEIAIL